MGDRRTLIRKALERLKPLRVSSLLETEPWGRTDQPRFINTVAEIATDLHARALLDRILGIERGLGRVRGERWGPRTIDLDLLLFNDLEIREEGLEVPHPRLAQRRFVLQGLADLCPARRVPGDGRTVRELLEACP